MILFFTILTITTLLYFFWVKGIDYLQKNYPNYKGVTFFDEEDKIHTC